MSSHARSKEIGRGSIKMYEHGSLPRGRQDGLLEETVGEELLLYDQGSHTAHCLSPIAACIWRHCDGERDVSELAVFAGVSESLVADALYELREKDLLDAEPDHMQSTVSGESRREAIGRVARYGAAAAAGTMIVSATAATPAMASSGEAPCKCQPAAKTNCCLCEKGCFTDTGSKTECETIKCTGTQGKFVEWKEKSEFVH
jgi:hypothetical protein